MKKVMERTFRRMNANRKNGKKALKGFTLVEIIVVLVILAILAAAMIPALTGYIDKANDRTLVAEARSILTAAQTLTSEAYGLNKTMEKDSGYTYADIIKLADLEGKGTITNMRWDTSKKKVEGFTWTHTGKKSVVYTGTDFSIS